MPRQKSPQASFYGPYLYDRIIPQDHLLRQTNQVVDFSFIRELVKDRYNPDFGRPAEDPEFILRQGFSGFLAMPASKGVISGNSVSLHRMRMVSGPCFRCRSTLPVSTTV